MKLSNDTLLYRAITKKGWVNPDTREIQAAAFILRFRKSTQNYEKGLSCDLRPEKSYQYLSKCFGILQISVGEIRELGLEVDNDHDSHVNIINLPHPELNEQKYKDIAAQLARKAKLYLDRLDDPFKKTDRQ